MVILDNTASPEVDSVFGLLTKLSEVIVRNDSPALSGRELIECVNKARSSLYGILLGKKCVKEVAALSSEVECMSPLSWLVAQRFSLNKSCEEKEYCDLDDAVREAFSQGWHESPPATLRTLICLANTGSVFTKADALSLEPFFTSHKLGLTGTQNDSRRSLRSRRIYPRVSPDIFKRPSWLREDHSFSSIGRYVTSYPFNCKPGLELPHLGSFIGGSEQSSDPGKHTYQLHPIRALMGPRELSLPMNKSQSNFQDEGYFTPMTDAVNEIHQPSKNKFEDQTKIWSNAMQVSLPAKKSWETLGNLITYPEKPFLSSASFYALIHLNTLVNLYQDFSNESFKCDPEPTSRVEFTRGILLLLIGVESPNFPFDKDSNVFVVREGMWLEGFSVDGTHDLCQDFIFCGTYFRKLEKFAHPRTSNTDTTETSNGIVVQSLICCLQRWTQLYRGVVLILSSHCQSQGKLILLHDLLDAIQPLKQEISCLSSLCCVESSEDSELALPSGVALLAHIYREACNKSDSQQNHLLYSALKSCCEAYLQCLQKWIFLGYCSNDERDELFVYKDPIYAAKRDRSFWIRGFILDKASVPVFLQGLEVAIFDCGRAMNLLKLCNPHHPLCVLLENRHPTIYCCLFKSDMEKVQKECAQFEEDAQRVCGDFVNVSTLLEEEQKHEASLHILVQEAQKKRDIARNTMRIQLEKEKAKIKEKQNADLKAQIVEIQKRKAAEKEQQRLEDEKYLEECQRQETALRYVEEKERQKVLAHYEELGKFVDKQNQLREWQMKRLKMSDKRQTFLYEDSVNLSRDCQLLEARASSVVGLDAVANNLISAVSSTSLVTVDNDTDSQGASHSLVVERDSQEEYCCNKPQVLDARHMVKEASVVEAKVLQSEHGQGLEKSVIDSGKPAQGDMKSNILNQTTSVSESVAESKPVYQKCELQTHADSESLTQISEVKADLDLPTELVKNRKRVLTEDYCWKSNSSMDVGKKSSADSGIVSEREGNRKRILGGEYNIITGCKVSDHMTDSSCSKRPQRGGSTLSDLQKNRRKVLNEEYNIYREDVFSKAVTAASVVTQADSGIDVENTASISTIKSNSDSKVATLLSNANDSFHSSVEPGHRQMTARFEDNASSRNVAFERPSMLSVSSDPSVISSPLMTPQGLMDVPVFTSPFKGTYNLPNGLPLASPMVNLARENTSCCEINGIPLMVDITDNFFALFNCDSHADSVDAAEVSKTAPNTSWLESSLQTCLLLPLRVQYRHVSSALVHFFLVDMKLLTHLKSLRSYYLMQDGEFGRDLTVKLFSQMYQVATPDKLLNALTLDKIMKQALASSQGTIDPNHSKLFLSVSHVPDHFSHSSPNVLDCLQLSYKVNWPLNLLLTPETFEKYNMIFLFLVRLKRVAWLLQEDFVALKNTARGCLKGQNRDLFNSPQYHQVQMIRHNMSQFVQATLNYVSSCVLHASWGDFAASLKQATTIDHIYNAHIEYIKRLLKRCLLNNKSQRVEVVLSKILRCIIKFHSNMRVRPWQVPSKQYNQQTPSAYLEHPNFQQLVACSVHFKLQVSKLVSYLERLISPPNQQQHLSEYLLMLNVNGFYKSSDYLKHAENVQEPNEKSALSTQTTS